MQGSSFGGGFGGASSGFPEVPQLFDTLMGRYPEFGALYGGRLPQQQMLTQGDQTDGGPAKTSQQQLARPQVQQQGGGALMPFGGSQLALPQIGTQVRRPV